MTWRSKGRDKNTEGGELPGFWIRESALKACLKRPAYFVLTLK